MKRYSTLFDLGLLTLFCIVIFGLFLGSRPLNVPDEGRYPNAAREMLVTHDYITPKVNGVAFLDKPALYYWLEAGSMKAFGVNNWAIRLPQALFGLLGCLLVYLFGRRFYSRKTGLIAATIMAVSPIYYFSARYANMDLEVALWITGTLLCFYRFYTGLADGPDKKNNKWIYLSAICAGFGVLTKGLIGLALPGLTILLFLLSQKQLHYLAKLKWLPNLCLIALICVPWYWAVQAYNPHFLYYFFVYQQFDRFTQGGFNNVMPFYFYLGILLVGSLPWSLITLPYLAKIKSVWQQRSIQPVTWFLVLWCGVITAFFSVPQSKIVGYILPVVPALTLLIARGLEQITLSFNRSAKISTLLWSVIACIAGIILWLIPGHAHHVPTTLRSIFWPLGTVLILASGLTFWLIRKHRMTCIILTWVVTMSIFASGAMLAVPKIDTKSALPLAQIAKPYLHKNTVLVSYQTYFEDLPIYLNHRFKIVYNWQDSNILNSDNWARDFYEGLQQHPQAAKHWLILPGQFKTLWQSAPSILVFCSYDDYQNLKHRLHPSPKLLGHYQGKAVFTKA